MKKCARYLKISFNEGDASMKVKLFEKAQEGNSPCHPSTDDSKKSKNRMMFTTIVILNSRNLNILLPGDGAKSSTSNGAKNKGE